MYIKYTTKNNIYISSSTKHLHKKTPKHPCTAFKTSSEDTLKLYPPNIEGFFCFFVPPKTSSEDTPKLLFPPKPFNYRLKGFCGEASPPRCCFFMPSNDPEARSTFFSKAHCTKMPPFWQRQLGHPFDKDGWFF